MKKVIAIAVAALMIATLSATAFATPAHAASVNANGALNIALKDAGLSKGKVTRIETENERNKFEIEFVQKGTRNEFSYEIAKNSGKIISKDVEYAYKKNSSKKKVSKADALKSVSKISKVPYSTVKKAKCTYSYKKNEGIYKVFFSHKGYKYEFEVLAPTGKVVEWDMDLINKKRA